MRVSKKRGKNETPRGVSFLPRFFNIKRHDPGKKRHEPKTIQSIISDIANATKNDTIGKSRTFDIITSGSYPLALKSVYLRSYYFIHQNKPDHVGYQEAKGFYDPSTYS